MNIFYSALKYTLLVWSIIFPFAFIHYVGNVFGVKRRSDKIDLTKKDSKKAKTYFKEDM